jgi:sulfite exporter TauE/SafE
MTVLGAAFLGSGHCFAMCGGVAAAVGIDGKNIAAYQGGRLLSYVTLGATAGAFGAELLASGWRSPLAFASAALFSLFFFAAAIALWRGGPLKSAALASLSARAWRGLPGFVKRTPVARAAAIGLLTPLFPCGWLYSFALLAAGTRSATAGGMVLGALWLGSLPSLIVAPAAMARWRHQLSLPQRRALAVVLILIGTYNLVSRVEAMRRSSASGSVATCHHGGGEKTNKEKP